ncbi:MAG: Insulinase (Peptidase M16) [Peltula sp. TS41687]|nr:MAG: Insulinase (Peptidase M16) [Peltula sp. TS41687]
MANLSNTASAIASPSSASELRSSQTVERLADRLETPALDDRSYRVIRLSNDLEVLLVHDPDTDKASAAMDVNVGSFSDTEDMPGMAHAVEHLLFMGTEKYPKENAYREYLTANSGHSNAYTAATSTNYYFELAASDKLTDVEASNPDGRSSPTIANAQKSPLYGALDRFAQFFVAPLFLASTLDRELQAVHSENKKNLQSDGWRLYQLSKSTSNPKHPYSHFSTGNLETLRDNPKERGVEVRTEFMKFHEQSYSANLMKLVVLGRESLDDLESWVVELFSCIRNKHLPKNRWDEEQPLTKDELLTQCFAKPVMDSHLLEITFPFMDEEQLYESQPGRYLSHLIGHEAPGSVLAYIKGRGWATGLSAGSTQICPGSSLFEVSIRLTEEGLKNYKAIVQVIFQYISLIRESGPQAWIFDEMKGMAEVNFRFKQKSPASDFTSKTSSAMQKPIPRAWLLSGSRLLRKFEPDVISRALEYLRSDNFRLTLVSHSFSDGLNQRERWYGTEYKLEKIPAEDLSEISKAEQKTSTERISELHLPHKNEFIPTQLEVEKRDVKEPLKAPRLIRNDEGVRTWWKKDDSFWVPKGNIFIRLRNPWIDTTPETGVKTALYCELVTDALVEYAYDAELAGLGYQLSCDSVGLQAFISGYNDKMAVLLEKVLNTMQSLEIKVDRFAVVKERLLEEYQNCDYQEPFRQIGDYTDWLNHPTGWLNEQYLAELPHLSASDIQHFYPQLLREVHIEMLVHGNLYKEDALRLTRLVESSLKSHALPSSQWPIQRSLVLPEGGNFVYSRALKDPANVNHGIETFMYVGLRSDRTLRAKLLLVAQITEEPAFDQLRTKEQLGYVVFSGVRATATTMGYRVIIQSEHPPDYLDERIDAFLRDFVVKLKEMGTAEFNDHKKSLIAKRLEKLKNLGQESRRLWTHIRNEYLDFDQVEQDVRFIEPLSQAEIIEFFIRYISPDSAARSKLTVYLRAQSLTVGLAKTLPPKVLKENMLQVLEHFLQSEGHVGKPDKIQQRLDGIDIRPENQQAIFSALKQYFMDDLSLEDDKAKAVLEKGQTMMSALWHNTAVEPEPEQEMDGDGMVPKDGTERPVKKVAIPIENIHDFRAKLPLTAGAQPLKDPREFEEVTSKL